MAKVNELTLGQAVAVPGLLRAYGKPVIGTPVTEPGVAAFSGSSAAIGLASIRAFAFGTHCIPLMVPVLFAVPGPGADPEDGDKCSQPGDRVWNLNLFDRSFALTQTSGTVEELIDRVSTKGIDGGVRLENPRIVDGKACCDLHVWAKIEVLGLSTGFDERIPICVPLEGCYTVWEIGIANVQICFQAPNRLCAKLCVGKWGISKCFDYCVTLPIAASAAVKTCSCPAA